MSQPKIKKHAYETLFQSAKAFCQNRGLDKQMKHLALDLQQLKARFRSEKVKN